MNTRESCVNHPRGATHRPQPTNLSCAQKTAAPAAADDGVSGVRVLFTLAYRYD